MVLGVTTNENLQDIAVKLKIGIVNIIPKEYINNKDGQYIINMDKKTGSGTHWVAYIKKKDIIYYFDSFGIPPLIEILKLNHTKIYYNEYNIQDIKDNSCGYYCLYFLYWMKKYKNDYKKMLSLFVNNTTNNKEIINRFFNKYII